jgi:hypothetical protein
MPAIGKPEMHWDEVEGSLQFLSRSQLRHAPCYLEHSTATWFTQCRPFFTQRQIFGPSVLTPFRQPNLKWRNQKSGV